MRQDAPEDGQEPSSDPLDHAARLLDEALREHAAGRPAQALAPCLQALSIADGEEAPPLELVVLNTLGVIRLDLCEFGDAHDSLRRAADVVDNLVADEQDAPVLTQLNASASSRIWRTSNARRVSSTRPRGTTWTRSLPQRHSPDATTLAWARC